MRNGVGSRHHGLALQMLAKEVKGEEELEWEPCVCESRAWIQTPPIPPNATTHMAGTSGWGLEGGATIHS